MTYKLQVHVADGVDVEVDADSWSELMAAYADLHGDPEALANHVESVMEALPYGEAVTTVARGLNGHVREIEHAQADERDPWGSDHDSEPAEKPTPTRTTPKRSAPASKPNGASSRGNSESLPPGAGKEKDKWGNEYTLNLPEAPDCECGEPAARKKGKSRAGNDYTVWCCAKAAPGGDYRDKCDFSEYVNKHRGR